MQDAQIPPDKVSYSAAMSACERACHWQVALELMSSMSIAQVVPDSISYNVAMSACEKGGQWQYAFQALAAMQSSRLQPDVISYSAVMSACARLSQWQLAVKLLHGMRHAGVVHDNIACSAAMSACANSCQWQLAISILSLMIQGEITPDGITYSAAINACEKGGQWQLALRVLSTAHNINAKLDRTSYSSAMSACTASSEWPLAIILLSDMYEARISHDLISYSVILGACEVGGQWQLVLSVLSSMVNIKVLPDSISYGQAMGSMEKMGQWQLALDLLSFIRAQGARPDAVSCGAAISTCGKCGQWELALHLLDLMPKTHVAPNAITCSAAISACQKVSQWQLAVTLLRSMTAVTVLPNQISYNASINACSKAGNWQFALYLLSLSSQIGMCVPSYGILLMECEKRNLRTIENALLQRLKGVSNAGILAPGCAAVLEFSAQTRQSHHDGASLVSAMTAALFRAEAPTSLTSSELTSLPYQRELQILKHVMRTAQPGRLSTIIDAIDGLLGSFEWTPFASGSKAATLLAAARGAPLSQADRETSAGVLEIGTYCGNTALRLASVLPGVRVTSLEQDPVFVAIARSLIGFAGLSSFVDVLTGHSHSLIPCLGSKLMAQNGWKLQPRFNVIFMDRWGTQYEEDLCLLEKHRLLNGVGCVFVADNVLATAAARFLWKMTKPFTVRKEGRELGDSILTYLARHISVHQVADPSLEDWMTIAVSAGQCPEEWAQPPMPLELEVLQEESERLRRRAVGSEGGVKSSQMPVFLKRVKDSLEREGIFAT
eukprot:TRINITY_DN11956_c0_g1_i2.p1 TRINITY_DN11956_c0_g1~~TRINITY_DN11956_c0_g1_i2.p1  ORF type:complete len:900 (+),score=134.00 TRINITY_DN11956_c0_g1_i2:360-2702(+)